MTIRQKESHCGPWRELQEEMQIVLHARRINTLLFSAVKGLSLFRTRWPFIAARALTTCVASRPRTLDKQPGESPPRDHFSPFEAYKHSICIETRLTLAISPALTAASGTRSCRIQLPKWQISGISVLHSSTGVAIAFLLTKLQSDSVYNSRKLI